ncbi:caspase family protein [Shinella zoogloeoides]|uniref:caspase family protein n=1 Tax=Shinella zoogloeoides TaxID=352475 RepID=UPI00273F46C4|nr:caspase family protein [Shinella zoogloeoides]WLR94263.1 caspase family protein [Shinella zoogloeoides]
MKIFLVALSFVVALCVSFAPAPANARRLALVVGSSDYSKVGQLPNASKDATDFASFLQQNGFDAKLVLNADRRKLAEELSRFAKELGRTDTALFYFAGHGMQFKGENYLLGVDATLGSELDIPAETVPLASIISAIESRAKTTLVFLDACRNNPLAEALNRNTDGTFRSVSSRGLAPIAASSAGTMVAFAASPGQVASDGDGQNSPFTRALIDHLGAPGLEIGTSFKRVIKQVRLATDSRQSPQLLSSLEEEFYLSSSALPDDAFSPVTSTVVEESAENEIEEEKVAVALQKELRRAGCYRGAIDGNWGAASQAALSRFARATRKRLDAPTVAALKIARNAAVGVCKECNKSQVRAGGRCKPKPVVGQPGMCYYLSPISGRLQIDVCSRRS